MLQLETIRGTSISDAWFQAMYKCHANGRKFKIHKGSFEGSFRLELDYTTIHITHPDSVPMLPKLNPQLGIPDPVEEGYIDDYLSYLMTDVEKEGESYTYGQRICDARLSMLEQSTKELMNQYWDKILEWQNETQPAEAQMIIKYDLLHRWHINQMEFMIWMYKHVGYRNNQLIMQVGQGSDMHLEDPPCLRQIDTRIQNDEEEEIYNLLGIYYVTTGEKFYDAHPDVEGPDATRSAVIKGLAEFMPDNMIERTMKQAKVYKLHFFPYFRSWDLYGGFPANIAAIEMMKQYCAAQIGVENGEIVAATKGLHIYDYTFEIAEAIRGGIPLKQK